MSEEIEREIKGRQTAVAALRAAWDTLEDGADADFATTDAWLDDLDADELRAGIRFLTTVVIGASRGVRDEDRGRFLAHVGTVAANPEPAY